MNSKLSSPKAHALTDYLLAAGLLTMPSWLGFNKKVKKLYAAEALILLSYIALTNTPVTLKPVIPFTTQGKIDPFNVAQFASQTFFKCFRKDKKAMWFNIACRHRCGAY